MYEYHPSLPYELNWEETSQTATRADIQMNVTALYRFCCDSNLCPLIRLRCVFIFGVVLGIVSVTPGVTMHRDHPEKRGGHCQLQQVALRAMLHGGVGRITHGIRQSAHFERLLLKIGLYMLEQGEVGMTTGLSGCGPHPGLQHTYRCIPTAAVTPRAVPPTHCTAAGCRVT